MPRPHLPYHEEKILHLNATSVAVLIVMIAYYAIVAFHFPITRAFDNPWAKTNLYFLALSCGIMCLGLMGKIGLLLIMREESSLKLTVAVSFYLIAFGAATLTIVMLASDVAEFLRKPYWQRSHWFWIGMLLFLLFSYIGYLFYRYNLYQWGVLRGLNGLSCGSPVVGFALPFGLSKNVAYLELPSPVQRVHAYVAILAALFFSLYLIVFYILTARRNARIDKPDWHRTNAPLHDRSVYACFCLFAVALYLLFYVLLDAIVLLPSYFSR